MNTPTHEHTTRFLYASIQDIVSTIRALDVKLQVILGVLLVPLAAAASNLKTVREVHDYCWNSGRADLAYGIVLLWTIILGSWVLGLLCAIHGLVGTKNPAKAIRGSEEVTGAFYYMGELRPSRWNPFRTVCYRRTLKQQQELLPKNENQAIRELTFEQMKLGYIRDIKMLRHKRAYLAATLSLISTASLLILLWKSGFRFGG